MTRRMPAIDLLPLMGHGFLPDYGDDKGTIENNTIKRKVMKIVVKPESKVNKIKR